MEFILKTVFDYNLERKRKIVHAIGNQLRSVLSIRSYSKMVEEINIDLYWTPKAIKVRRPIYHEDKTVKVFPHDKNNDATFRMYHLLFVDIPLPEEFVTCSEEEAVAMIGETMVNYFKNVALPVKIRNSFDKERFVSDLQSFFSTYKQQL